MATALDEASLLEIMDGFTAGGPVAPSERMLQALAAASGQSAAAVRAAFEARHRAAGHETALCDEMPFSGSG